MATLKDKILLSEKRDELIKLLISDQSTAYKKSVLDGENIHLTKAQISALVAQFRAAALDSEDSEDSEDQDQQSEDGETLEAISLDNEALFDLIEDIQGMLLAKNMSDKDYLAVSIAPALATQIHVFRAQMDNYVKGLGRYPLENLKYLKELASIYLSFRK